MRNLIIFATVIGCMFLGGVGVVQAVEPRATDKELLLEWQLNESRVQQFNSAIKEIQTRQQVLAAEIKARPSIVGTAGVKPPAKAKGKK